MYRFFSSLILLGIACGQPSAQQVKPQKTEKKAHKEPAWKTTVTEDGESGQPMIISGTVYAPDGETPLAGMTVYVYHTDDRGYYAPHDAMDNRNPRLHATMVTNEDGRYEYTTIKPGPYPGGGTPAHVHYVVSGNGYGKQKFELHFDGDPYLSDYYYDRDKKGRFSSITTLDEEEEGVLRGRMNVLME